MSQQAILHLENVVKKRVQGTGYTLRIPKLSIYEGERIAILGVSGSGKSTVMDMLAFLLEPDEIGSFTFMPKNDIRYDIKSLWEKKSHGDELTQIRLQHLGVILQSGALLPFLSVRDNIVLAMQAQHGHIDESFIEDLAKQLGIAHLLRAMPHTLSLGERQRVAIGRTLAAKPSIILADEPTAALDPAYAQMVMELLTQAVDAMKTSLIFVTHDVHLAQKNAMRLLEVTLQQDDTELALPTIIATLHEAGNEAANETGNEAASENAYV